jgi:hypothetical protein
LASSAASSDCSDLTSLKDYRRSAEVSDHQFDSRRKRNLLLPKGCITQQYFLSCSLLSVMNDVWSGTMSARRRRIRKFLALLYMAAISLPVKGFSVQQQQRCQLRTISPAFCAKETLLPVTKVEKRNSNTDESKRRPAPNKRTALRWVVESIERLGQDPELILERPSAQLMDALYRLQKGENAISYNVSVSLFFLMMYFVSQHERSGRSPR